MPTSSNCDVCGWKGDPRPRKIMYNWMYEEKRNATAEDIALKKAGKLFFVRIYLVDPKVDIDEKLEELLNVENLGGPTRDPPRYLIRVSKKPTEETIKHIKELKGVIKVTVY